MKIADDRRSVDVMKVYFAPVLAAIVAGVFLGGMTSLGVIKFNEGETVAWRNSIEVQITSVMVIVKAVQQNQLKIATIDTLVQYVGNDVKDIEDRLIRIEENTVSDDEAKARTLRLEREIEMLWAAHQNNNNKSN